MSKRIIHARRWTAMGLALVHMFTITSFAVAAEAPPPASSQAAARRSGDPLADGRELYLAGEYAAAVERLDVARRANPGDPRAALLLGLASLRLDDPAKASVAWKDYVKLGADPALSADLKKYLTIVQREANQRSARAAVEDEKKLSSEAPDPRLLAVVPLRNLGTSEMAPLGRGLSAMLAANLSGIPGVKVLEREQVQTLIDEAQIGESGLVEKATAVRAGRLLRAGRVTAGSYLDWTASPTHLKIDAVVFDVDRAGELGTYSAESLLDEFHTLVPQIASSIAAAVGTPVDRLPKVEAERVTEDHTRSLPAVLAFSRGLAFKDAANYPAARAELELALEKDPKFDLARRELEALPAVLLSLAAVGNAVESAALGGAIGVASAASSRTGPAGATASSESFLSRNKWWFLGGAVVAGGAAVAIAAGGGGGGGGGGGATPPLVIEGASNRTVAVGQTLTFAVTGRGPTGTTVNLAANLGPLGQRQASFAPNPATGTPAATGTLSFSPGQGDEGTYSVTFTATDAAGALAPVSQTIQIIVTPPSGGSTPTPTLGLTGPTPTPTPPTSPTATSTSTAMPSPTFVFQTGSQP